MGGLVGGIYDLFAGDPTEKEQNQIGNLGEEQIGTGEGLVTPAATYYQNILSGDPTKIAQSLAPEISAGQKQVEQQAKTNSEFGQRSGGTAASTAAAEDQNRGNIINLVGGLQKSTADSAGALGSEQENAGSSNVNTEANMAQQNRQRVVGDIGGIASSAAEIAAPFLGGAGAATDPYASLYNAQHADLSGLSPEEDQPTEGIQ